LVLCFAFLAAFIAWSLEIGFASLDRVSSSSIKVLNCWSSVLKIVRGKLEGVKT
jgi:hypothetical protein